MGSSRPDDRSLGNGISFPQWMRGKVDSRFDFDESSFSPPTDDNFFHIKYPTTSSTSAQSKQSGFHSINQVLNEQKTTTTTTADNLKNLTSEKSSIKDNKKIDTTKLPLPCQAFVKDANKSYLYEAKGTDDGFHSEPARCGKSIVTVANRIMQSSNVFKKTDENKTNENMDKINNLQQKVSKSLPVTPIASPTSTPEGSPKSRRRVNGNRYFTGSFIPEKYQGGWLLTKILSNSREIIGNKIDEGDEAASEVIPHRALARKKSISSQNLSYLGKDDVSTDKPIKIAGTSTSTPQTVTLQVEPSELREMNFWSPTSM
ncbi:uncharacterized protein LOC122858889 isoform X2 [Aphidius gifuensis]|uniref:uncharacterized protein LOC122858889 isoform X2 n=1 Tax=Aphidius gifuensis TaxID=684658 RepID=UPI001CDB9983|nr:uncharacterized protein LOC122858889 isoform X2 [Aphidius gifuensis]